MTQPLPTDADSPSVMMRKDLVTGENTAQILWSSWDVPRIWDVIKIEGDEYAQSQWQGFANLASLLNAHADKLTKQRAALAAAWPAQNSPAAAAALNRVDGLIEAFRADAAAAE